MDDIKKLKKIEAEERDLLRGRLIHSQNAISLSLGDFKIVVRECEASAQLKVFTEIFKEDLHFLVPSFFTNNTKRVLDLGSNIGFFSLKLKSLLPDCRVAAVEPSKESIMTMKKNLRLNNLDKEVVYINKAVADKQGITTILSTDHASTLTGKYLGRLEKSNRPWLQFSTIKKNKVITTTLTQVLDSLNWASVDLIKIDIQDMELEALSGSATSLNRIKRIILEPHANESSQKVGKILSSYGFTLIYAENREFGDQYWRNIKYS